MTQETRPVGRPKWIPTPEILTRIENYKKRGITEYSIANLVGCSPATFAIRKREFPELVEALQRGESAGADEITAKLWEIAMNDKHRSQASILMFLAKSKYGFSDSVQPIETKEKPSGINLVPLSVIPNTVAEEPLDVDDAA